MKKLLLLVTLLALAMPAHAEKYLLLDAATATGAGSDVNTYTVDSETLGLHSVQVNTTGSPTAVTVALEGSLNDDNYVALATHSFSAAEISAGYAMFHVVNKPVKHLRANVTTLTGGSSPTVTVYLVVE